MLLATHSFPSENKRGENNIVKYKTVALTVKKVQREKMKQHTIKYYEDLN